MMNCCELVRFEVLTVTMKRAVMLSPIEIHNNEKPTKAAARLAVVP
jgi:hypothetical protein